MTNNLKDELIQLQKDTLKDARKLTNHLHDINAWSMEIQKKYMNKETEVWHLSWKVKWLERVLRKNNPGIKLYEDDPEVQNKVWNFVDRDKRNDKEFLNLLKKQGVLKDTGVLNEKRKK